MTTVTPAVFNIPFTLSKILDPLLHCHCATLWYRDGPPARVLTLEEFVGPNGGRFEECHVNADCSRISCWCWKERWRSLSRRRVQMSTHTVSAGSPRSLSVNVWCFILLFFFFLELVGEA